MIQLFSKFILVREFFFFNWILEDFKYLASTIYLFVKFILHKFYANDYKRFRV